MSSETWHIDGVRRVSYDVVMRRDVLDPTNPCLAASAGFDTHPPDRLVVSDRRVWELYGAALLRYGEHHGIACRPAVVDSAESEKDIVQVLAVVDACSATASMRRRTPLIALGGGTVLDIAGLAASLYRRGVPLVRVPTTLVGMIDAGIGVKTAVNRRERKSAIGSYHAPTAVIVDPGFLRTLDEREVGSGIAEAIKIALVTDPELFALIESETKVSGTKLSETALAKLVARAISAMVAELSENLWEDRLERLSDFGHSFGPAIEMAALPRLTHGETVALDIALSVAISQRRDLLADATASRILNVLASAGLPVYDEVITTELLSLALAATTDHRDGLQRVPLLTDIGHASFVNDISATDLDAAVQILRSAHLGG